MDEKLLSFAAELMGETVEAITTYAPKASREHPSIRLLGMAGLEIASPATVRSVMGHCQACPTCSAYQTEVMLKTTIATKLGWEASQELGVMIRPAQVVTRDNN